MTNFTLVPVPDAPIITNSYGNPGYCIHLTHDFPAPQLMQCDEALYPTNGASITFVSVLGASETNEVARVEVSTNAAATWQDIYVEPGNGGFPASYEYSTNIISLAGYSGQEILLRFNYDFDPPYEYFVGNDPFLGWQIANISVTNVGVQVMTTTNTPLSTNFTFTPTQPGTYVLQVVPLIFTEFPIDSGPPKAVTVVSSSTPTIVMSAPRLANNEVLLNFTLTSGTAANFQLLQATQINGGWTTNTTAAFTTNVPGLSYRFTTTNTPTAKFFRVRTP